MLVAMLPSNKHKKMCVRDAPQRDAHQTHIGERICPTKSLTTSCRCASQEWKQKCTGKEYCPPIRCDAHPDMPPVTTTCINSLQQGQGVGCPGCVAQLNPWSGRYSEFVNDDEDEEEEEEEDDSEEDDVDEEQESEDEAHPSKRVGESVAKLTTKAATPLPLAPPPSEEEPVKKAGKRGKRRPAMTSCSRRAGVRCSCCSSSARCRPSLRSSCARMCS